MLKDIKNVIATWLVDVNPNATCPIKLLNKIKKNITNKNGKYLYAFLPACSSIILKINLNNNSKKYCQKCGIKVSLVKPNVKTKIKVKVANAKLKLDTVKAISKLKNLKLLTG